MSAREELLALYQRDGYLTPESVVDVATEPTHPLHPHFEWDETEAARRYRLVQAGMLIRRCKITIDISPEETRRVRAFVSVPQGDSAVYMPTDQALTDEHRDLVLQQALRDVAALRRKYAALIDIDALFRSVLAEDAA